MQAFKPVARSGTQFHIAWPVNGFIVNSSHCDYMWSSVRYSFVYIIKRNMKLTLVTLKNENKSEYVMPRRLRDLLLVT